MKGIIAIDVETTGISPEKERIIEIGAVRPETGEVFRTLIHPGRPLPEHITELTGITGEMLVDAPEEADAEELPGFRSGGKRTVGTCSQDGKPLHDQEIGWHGKEHHFEKVSCKEETASSGRPSDR